MTIVGRASLGQSWDEFCDAHPAAWWWHRTEWLDYCLAHSGGQDHSFGIMYGEELLAICPLIQEGEQFSAGGDPLPWPVYSSDEKQFAEDCDACAIRDEIERLAIAHRVTRVSFRQSPLTPSATGYVPLSLDRAYKDISWQSQVIDLTVPDLWAGVKEGHRADIHRGLRELEITLCRNDGDFWAFQALHRIEAGRETRPRATWDLMLDWLHEGYGKLFMARLGIKTVGGAYFIGYKSQVYYASAAWPNSHVAHAVLWIAMRTFQRSFDKQLEMGWLGHADDEKGKSVEWFKTRFGGDAKPLRCVEKRW